VALGLTRVGFLSQDDDARRGRRFRMIENAGLRVQESLIARGDDVWIEDEQGERVYRIDDRALLIRDAFILRDAHGNELAKVQEGERSDRDAIRIECQGKTIATVHKTRAGLHHRFSISVPEGADLNAHGHLDGHEYEIRRDGDVIASVSKRWFAESHTYGIDISDGEDEPLLLALTVALDQLRHR
jgi:uncharacterized protein YxjI